MRGAGRRTSSPGSPDAAGPPMRSAFAGTAAAAASRRCSSPASTISSPTSNMSPGSWRHRRCSSGIRWGPPSSSGCWRPVRSAPRRCWRPCRPPDCSQWPRGSLPRIRITFPTSPISIRRSSPTACSRRCGRSISAPACRPPSCRKPSATCRSSRRARCSTCRYGCTWRCPNGRPRRSWCWARTTTGSARRPTHVPPRTITASRRPSCREWRTC